MASGEPFDELANQNTEPTMPAIDIARVRAMDVAKRLESAKTQAYVEANVATQVLDLLDKALALLPV